MSEPAETPEPESEDERPERQEGQAETTRRRRGRKPVREKVEDFLDEVDPTGWGNLMDAAGRYVHRLTLRSAAFTPEGGPLDELLEIVERLNATLRRLVPGARPHAAVIAPTNSMEIAIYAPISEMEVSQEETPDARDDAEEKHVPQPTELPLPRLLPHTTLAVAALAQLSMLDADEAVRTARALSPSIGTELGKLTATLWDKGVDLDLGAVKPEARFTVERSQAITERTDAAVEVPNVLVKVLGVLDGARSGKRTFELIPDRSARLDPALGPNRPDRVLRGELSPHAYRQIRQQNLWSAHVEARIKVFRRRRGRTFEITGLRMTSIERRYRRGRR